MYWVGILFHYGLYLVFLYIKRHLFINKDILFFCYLLSCFTFQYSTTRYQHEPLALRRKRKTRKSENRFPADYHRPFDPPLPTGRRSLPEAFCSCCSPPFSSIAIQQSLFQVSIYFKTIVFLCCCGCVFHRGLATSLSSTSHFLIHVG